MEKRWGLVEGSGETRDISVITPVYNEAPNISPLIDRLVGVLHRIYGIHSNDFEIIAVNDGSRDGSLRELKAKAAHCSQLKIVDFRRNFGQTAAIMAGIHFATGRILVTIDADLQNDPEDIPQLLMKISEGFDVVSGWRKDRKDKRWSRTFVSQVANRMISKISGIRLRDYGCTLKAYRSDMIKGVRLYGEMHRFLPIYASWMGAKVTEIAVRHHPRNAGKSNYGLDRIAKVLLDVLVVKFLERYMAKPIYVLGGFAIISFFCAFSTLALSVVLRFAAGISMIQTPLPLLAAMLFLIGCMGLLLGLVAEMVVRTYFESQGRPPYLVRELVNFEVRD